MQPLSGLSFHSSDINNLCSPEDPINSTDDLTLDSDSPEWDFSEIVFDSTDNPPQVDRPLSSSIRISANNMPSLTSNELTTIFIDILNQQKEGFLDILEGKSKNIQENEIGVGQLKLQNDTYVEDTKKLQSEINLALEKQKLVVGILAAKVLDTHKYVLKIKFAVSANPFNEQANSENYTNRIEVIKGMIMRSKFLGNKYSGLSVNSNISLLWEKSK